MNQEPGRDELLKITVAIAFLVGALLTGYLGWTMMQDARQGTPSPASSSR